MIIVAKHYWMVDSLGQCADLKGSGCGSQRLRMGLVCAICYNATTSCS